VFVQQVLDCRNKYAHIVETSYHQDRKFEAALKEALEYFINLDSRSAQYLSLYIDDMFKQGLKGVNDDEKEARLDEVIIIFRYLQDKDVFEDFYKQVRAARCRNVCLDMSLLYLVWRACYSTWPIGC